MIEIFFEEIISIYKTIYILTLKNNYLIFGVYHMTIKKVTVHKMFEEFHQLPLIQYIGEYDDKNNLVKLFNSLNQELIRIAGTFQWTLKHSNEIYFVEEDPVFQARTP